MSRTLKPQIVKDVTIESKSLQLMLDRNSLEFFIVIASGVEARADNKDDCIREARELMRELKAFTWTPHIYLVHNEPEKWVSGERRKCGDNYAEIVVGFFRLESSPHPFHEKKWVQRKHRLDVVGSYMEDNGDYDRWERGEIEDNTYTADCVQIPYDQAKWDALVLLKDQLAKTAEQFKRMVKDHPELIGTGLKLLSMGQNQAQVPPRRRKSNGAP